MKKITPIESFTLSMLATTPSYRRKEIYTEHIESYMPTFSTYTRKLIRKIIESESNMTMKKKTKCDCKNHVNQVCDICQAPVGKPDKVKGREGKLDVKEMNRKLVEYLEGSTPEELRADLEKRKHLQNVPPSMWIVKKGKRYNTVREMLADSGVSKKVLKKFDELVANDVPLYYDDGRIAGWLDKKSFRVELVTYLDEGKKDLPIGDKDGKVSSSEDRMIGYH